MKKKTKKASNTMWGGRFEDKPDALLDQINASISIDQRLWRQDIAGSIAHCEMLAKQDIIPKADAQKILKGLAQIEKEIESGSFVFKTELEDIHMNIESRLKEIIGEAAGKLHTARSRNDQVATDFRLWVRDAIDDLSLYITDLTDTLNDLAAKHKKDPMPGFTHLQAAQPITLALHLEAYVQMLERDLSRLADCRKRLNECPLGSAALAGTPYKIDRKMTAKALGFDRPTASTMDGVSSRDFATEFLFACAQCGLNLSRLAEEIVLWSTPQFGFIRLSDTWSTGSSIMPQKKNPDAAELIRAKTGRLGGNLNNLMTVLKGLPLAYNKDLQEDKAPVFDSFDTLALCLQAMRGMLETAAFDTARMLEAAEDGYTTATRLADWLVMELGIAFRDAHHITGTIVKMAEKKGCKLHELALSEMQAVEKRISNNIFAVLRVKKS
ncbi:MAG: argininosuccinate lyase [Alphaproteobacteria bacterium]|nr:argininosuccinate lyase [Alphaproteobacteria bacterium]MBP7758486.1 argininosuccinate lyase [Alphaproteobacteria bacterium]MBP7762767.1 argininosuccinate lyase [Alphaproteobacteria bacterium]MBP7905855.1 argininosuccinate lyase [Alphaproteobacteria bacterium]